MDETGVCVVRTTPQWFLRGRLHLERLLALLFGALALGLAARPALAQDMAPDDRADAAQRLLENTLASDGGSGIMAAVVEDGRVVWHGEAGFANLEQAIPLAGNHRLRIGSVSKFVTAALVLRLADEGRFDVDAPIRDYLPDLPESYAAVTADQLARHLSGMRHYDFGNFAEANNTIYHRWLMEPLEPLVAEPLLAPPGEHFVYSSFGYNLLGAALEAHLDQRFEQVLQAHLAAPLGLTDTLANDALAIVPRRAGFYTVTVANPVFDWMADGELVNTIYRDDSDLFPSGGLLSTASDLALLGHAVFATDLLSEAARARLVRSTVDAAGEPARLGPDGYGFGTIQYRRNGEVWGYGHGGLTNGGSAELIHLPASGITIAVIANYNAMGPSAFDRLVRERLPALFKGSDPDQ